MQYLWGFKICDDQHDREMVKASKLQYLHDYKSGVLCSFVWLKWRADVCINKKEF